jgi:hypothetical protein
MVAGADMGAGLHLIHVADETVAAGICHWSIVISHLSLWVGTDRRGSSPGCLEQPGCDGWPLTPTLPRLALREGLTLIAGERGHGAQLAQSEKSSELCRPDGRVVDKPSGTLPLCGAFKE